MPSPILECYVLTPQRGFISFGNRYLNLSEIGRRLRMDRSHLSKIFSGGRGLSVETAGRIAMCLGMGLDEFVRLHKAHVSEVWAEIDARNGVGVE